MIFKWHRWIEKYTHNAFSRHRGPDGTFPKAPAYKFFLRREAMVLRNQESTLVDEAAIKLLYGEARSKIMSGKYPLVNANEVVMLSALHLHILFGNFVPEKHGGSSAFIT